MGFMSIFHRKQHGADLIRKTKNNAPYPLVWQRKELPDAGAGQYAFETYGTPTYDFALGNGATFIRKPLRATSPAQWQKFTWPILLPSNNYQGQFATQPLMDPNSAIAAGFMSPGNVPPDAYNQIPPSGLVIAP